MGRILAHKMHEFTPRHVDRMDKQRLLDSYLVGDGFIAMYKKHERKGTSSTKKQQVDDETEEEGREDGKEGKKLEIDLDEDDREDAELADKAMFNWLKSHYGTDVPEEQDMEEEEYDYTDLYKEIFDNEEKKEAMEKAEEEERRRKEKEMEEEEVSDVDVYVSDIERDDGEDEEIMNRIEDEMALDDLEMDAKMTEEERIKIGNEMMMEDMDMDNVMLPEDVEFESNEEMSDDEDAGTGADLAFLREEGEDKDGENESTSEDMGDFFAEPGVHHGQLEIDE